MFHARVARAALSLSTANTQYLSDIAAVNACTAGVISTKLPALNNPPPNYAAYQALYVQAEAQALGWTNNVMGPLTSIPVTIQNSNTLVTLFFQQAIGFTEMLVKNPSDPNARAALINVLQTLELQIKGTIGMVTVVLTDLNNFNNSLPALSSQLTSLANDMKTTSGADQAQITQLQQDVASCRSEINKLTAAIVGLGIVDAAAVVFGIVAVAAAGPIGAVTWIFLGAAAAVATYYIVLDGMKISALKDQIAADQSKMDSLTTDIAALNLASDNYAALANQTLSIQDNLNRIIQAWQLILTATNDTLAQVLQAESDAGSNVWNAVLTDLNNAQAAWATVITDVAAVDLQSLGNPAQLQLGMSEKDVSAAMAAKPTVTFQQFINAAAS